jgi:hypothetical protein
MGQRIDLIGLPSGYDFRIGCFLFSNYYQALSIPYVMQSYKLTFFISSGEGKGNKQYKLIEVKRWSGSGPSSVLFIPVFLFCKLRITKNINPNQTGQGSLLCPRQPQNP